MTRGALGQVSQCFFWFASQSTEKGGVGPDPGVSARWRERALKAEQTAADAASAAATIVNILGIAPIIEEEKPMAERSTLEAGNIPWSTIVLGPKLGEGGYGA